MSPPMRCDEMGVPPWERIVASLGRAALEDVETDPGRPIRPAGLPRAEQTTGSPNCTKTRPWKAASGEVWPCRSCRN